MEMRLFSKISQKTASVLLSLALLIDPALGQTETASRQSFPSPSAYNDSNLFSQGMDDLTLLGFQKGKSYQGNASQDFILIRDLHCEPRAQGKIAQAILELEKKGICQIFMEGAEGPLRTLLYRSFPDERIRKDTARKFLNEGYLTGAEFAVIAHGRESELELVGVEDSEIYLENFKAFRNARRKYQALLPLIQSFTQSLEILKQEKYSKELKELDEIFWKMKEGKLEIEFMVKIFKKIGLESKRLQEWEEMVKLTKSMDSKKIQEGLRLLMKDLAKRLDEEEMKEVIERTLEYRIGKLKPSEYLGGLRQKITEAYFDKTYSALEAWRGLCLRQETFDLEGLIQEGQLKLKESILRLAQKEKVEPLVQLDQDWRRLNRLFKLELSREELEELKRELKNGLVSILQENISEQIKTLHLDFSSIDLQPLVESAWQFYNLAEQRDSVLAGNALKTVASYQSLAVGFQRTETQSVKQDNPSPLRLRGDRGELQAQDPQLATNDSTQQRVAVLITGGFHTEGIQKILEEKGISYTTWTPQVKGDLSSDLYEKIMMDRAYDLDGVEFSQKRLTIHGSEAVRKMLQNPAVTGNIWARVGEGGRPVLENLLRTDLERKLGQGISLSQIFSDWLTEAWPDLDDRERAMLRLLLNPFLNISKADRGHATEAQVWMRMMAEAFGQDSILTKIAASYFDEEKKFLKASEHVQTQRRMSPIFYRDWEAYFQGQDMRAVTQSALDGFWEIFLAGLSKEGIVVPDQEIRIYRRIFSSKNISDYVALGREINSKVFTELFLKMHTLVHAFQIQKEDLEGVKGLTLSEVDEIVDESAYRAYLQRGEDMDQKNDSASPKTGMVIIGGVGGDFIGFDPNSPSQARPDRMFEGIFFIRQMVRRDSIEARQSRGIVNWIRDFLVLYKKSAKDTRPEIFSRDRSRLYVDHVRLKQILKKSKKKRTVQVDVNIVNTDVERVAHMIHYAGYAFAVFISFDPFEMEHIYLLTKPLEEQMKGQPGALKINLKVAQLSDQQEQKLLKILYEANLRDVWTEHFLYPIQRQLSSDQWLETLADEEGYQSAKERADRAILEQIDHFTQAMTLEEVQALKILDLACGDGTLMHRIEARLRERFPSLKKLNITGVEKTRELADRCCSKGLAVYQGDARDLSRFQDDAFDVVIAEGLFSNGVITSQDAVAILGQIHRVVKPVPIPAQSEVPQDVSRASAGPSPAKGSAPAKNVAVEGLSEMEDTHPALDQSFDRGSVLVVKDSDLDEWAKKGFQNLTPREMIDAIAKNIHGQNQQFAAIRYWVNQWVTREDRDKNLGRVQSCLARLEANRGQGSAGYRYVISMEVEGEPTVFDDLFVLGHTGRQRKTTRKAGERSIYIPEGALIVSEKYQGLDVLMSHEKRDSKRGFHEYQPREGDIIPIFWKAVRQRRIYNLIRVVGGQGPVTSAKIRKKVFHALDFILYPQPIVLSSDDLQEVQANMRDILGKKLPHIIARINPWLSGDELKVSYRAGVISVEAKSGAQLIALEESSLADALIDAILRGEDEDRIRDDLRSRREEISRLLRIVAVQNAALTDESSKSERIQVLSQSSSSLFSKIPVVSSSRDFNGMFEVLKELDQIRDELLDLAALLEKTGHHADLLALQDEPAAERGRRRAVIETWGPECTAILDSVLQRVKELGNLYGRLDEKGRLSFGPSVYELQQRCERFELMLLDAAHFPNEGLILGIKSQSGVLIREMNSLFREIYQTLAQLEVEEKAGMDLISRALAARWNPSGGGSSVKNFSAGVKPGLDVPEQEKAVFTALDGGTITFSMVNGEIQLPNTSDPKVQAFEKAMGLTETVVSDQSSVVSRKTFYQNLSRTIRSRKHLQGRTDLNGPIELVFGSDIKDERFRTLFGNHKRDREPSNKEPAKVYCNLLGLLNISNPADRQALFFTGFSHEMVHEFLPEEEQEGEMLEALEEELAEEDANILKERTQNIARLVENLDQVTHGLLVVQLLDPVLAIEIMNNDWRRQFSKQGGGKRHPSSAMVRALKRLGEHYGRDVGVRIYPGRQEKEVIGVLRVRGEEVLCVKYNPQIKALEPYKRSEKETSSDAGGAYDWEWLEKRLGLDRTWKILWKGDVLQKVGRLRPMYERYVELLGISSDEERTLRPSLMTAVMYCVSRNGDPEEAIGIYFEAMRIDKSQLNLELKKQMIVATYAIAASAKEAALREVIEIYREALGGEVPEALREQWLTATYHVAMYGRAASLREVIKIYRGVLGGEIPEALMKQWLIATYAVAMDGNERILENVIVSYFQCVGETGSMDQQARFLRETYRIVLRRAVGRKHGWMRVLDMQGHEMDRLNSSTIIPRYLRQFSGIIEGKIDLHNHLVFRRYGESGMSYTEEYDFSSQGEFSGRNVKVTFEKGRVRLFDIEIRPGHYRQFSDSAVPQNSYERDVKMGFEMQRPIPTIEGRQREDLADLILAVRNTLLAGGTSETDVEDVIDIVMGASGLKGEELREHLETSGMDMLAYQRVIVLLRRVLKTDYGLGENSESSRFRIARMSAGVKPGLDVPEQEKAVFTALDGGTITFSMVNGEIQLPNTSDPKVQAFEKAMGLTETVVSDQSSVVSRKTFYQNLSRTIRSRKHLQGRTDLNGPIELVFGSDIKDERFRTLFGNHKRDRDPSNKEPAKVYCNLLGLLNISNPADRQALFFTGFSHEMVHEFLPEEEQTVDKIDALERQLMAEDVDLLIAFVKDAPSLWVDMDQVLSGPLVDSLGFVLNKSYFGIRAIPFTLARQYILKAIEQYFKNRPVRLADIGSNKRGLADLIEKLHPEISVYSLDMTPHDGFHYSRHVVGRAEDMPFDDEVFEGVISSFSLEYMKREEAVREIKRTLKPGGKGIFILHHRNSTILGDEVVKEFQTVILIFQRLQKIVLQLKNREVLPSENMAETLLKIETHFKDNSARYKIRQASSLLLKAIYSVSDEQRKAGVKEIRKLEDRLVGLDALLEYLQNEIKNLADHLELVSYARDNPDGGVFKTREEIISFFIEMGFEILDGPHEIRDPDQADILSWGVVVQKLPARKTSAAISRAGSIHSVESQVSTLLKSHEMADGSFDFAGAIAEGARRADAMADGPLREQVLTELTRQLAPILRQRLELSGEEAVRVLEHASSSEGTRSVPPTTHERIQEAVLRELRMLPGVPHVISRRREEIEAAA